MSSDQIELLYADDCRDPEKCECAKANDGSLHIIVEDNYCAKETSYMNVITVVIT